MKPLLHAKISAKKFGGKYEDYLELHNWMDSTKAHLPDARHRMVLHNAWGIFLGEQIFGAVMVNSKGKDVSVRSVLEQHVLDDLGHIPTLKECMNSLDLEPWMGLNIPSKRPKVKLDLSKHNIEIVD